MGHGGSAQPGGDSQGLASCPHAFEPTGFGYLLGPPRPGQHSRLGEDPIETQRLLAALAAALPPAKDYWKTSLPGASQLDDNPFIPAGYTYLLQLVAHDMVQTSVPFWVAASLGLDSRNLRSSPLILDTLYGGGPNAATMAYHNAGNATGDRALLRVGRFDEATDTGGYPAHDLARFNYGGDLVEIANFAEPYITCAADPRNDDNLVLAQLVALFASVHNSIARQLSASRPEAVFGYAQAAMQSIYHSIIQNDLLPRLLHPGVSKVMRERAADDQYWLWRTDAVPLEFTHGAFRIGHAMVRHDYEFNAATSRLEIATVLDGGKFKGETRLTAPSSWIIEWARFFNLRPDIPVNHSRRLSPARSVLDPAKSSTAEDTLQPKALVLRDLLSAALARTWRVDALLDEICAHKSNPIPADWRWRDSQLRHADIHQWLSKHCAELAPADIDTLAADPPLPLFVLLESALDDRIGGRHLGPLGSTIVGEVIYRSMNRQRRRVKMTVAAATAAFDPVFREDMATIRSMPALLEFAGQHAMPA